jgi:hypothetical protein
MRWLRMEVATDCQFYRKEVRRMSKLKKRSGYQEDFDKTKVEKSLRNAGVAEETASKIAEKLRPSEGTPTSEVRRQIVNELKTQDPETGRRYESIRALVAKATAGVGKAAARLQEETLKALGAKAGEVLELEHFGKKDRVKAEKSAVNQREIHLRHETLRTLGAPEGKKLAVRRG